MCEEKIVSSNGGICPFCNSSTGWCGEVEEDEEDRHVCHQIVCTNKACGARFDFDIPNSFWPDVPEGDEDSEVTSLEILQPLRDEVLRRFMLRPLKSN